MKKWVVVRGINDRSIWGVKPKGKTEKDTIYTITEGSAENLANILNTLENKLDRIYSTLLTRDEEE